MLPSIALMRESALRGWGLIFYANLALIWLYLFSTDIFGSLSMLFADVMKLLTPLIALRNGPCIAFFVLLQVYGCLYCKSLPWFYSTHYFLVQSEVHFLYHLQQPVFLSPLAPFAELVIWLSRLLNWFIYWELPASWGELATEWKYWTTVLLIEDI